MQAGKNVTASDIKEEKSEKYPYLCYGGNGIRGYVAKYNTTGCFPLVGRQGALCGNVNIAEGNFWATEHAVVTNGFGLTEIMWQYYFLTALNLNKLATATAQPGLAVSNVIESLIPLPPLAEQKRIVAKIEQVLGEIDKLKR
jgi:type I restriction enzyme S subunit